MKNMSGIVIGQELGAESIVRDHHIIIPRKLLSPLFLLPRFHYYFASIPPSLFDFSSPQSLVIEIASYNFLSTLIIRFTILFFRSTKILSVERFSKRKRKRKILHSPPYFYIREYSSSFLLFFILLVGYEFSNLISVNREFRLFLFFSLSREEESEIK